MELKKGMLARSKAGHDKDQLYVVLSIEEKHVWLVNGTTKPVNGPKKKKYKHLQPIGRIPENLKDKLQTGTLWTNEEVKRAIKLAQTEFIEEEL